MKRSFFLCFLVLSFIDVFAQKLDVAEKFHAIPFEILKSDDIRKDANGIPCALVKVQLPVENVVFEGNVVDVVFKTNEYWVFLTAGTKRLRVKCPGALPLDVDATSIEPGGLKSKAIYCISLLFNRPDKIEPSQNPDIPVKEYFVEDLVRNAFGAIPISSLLKDSETTFKTVKGMGLNPELSNDGDVRVFMTCEPEKCKGFNAVKMQCKLDGCEIIPNSVSMGYEPSKYDDGRITYQFSWPHGNKSDIRKEGKVKSVEFAKFILKELMNAGYDMKGDYTSAKCPTSLGEITLVCNDNYGSCWVGLYVDTYYRKKD